MSTDYQRSDTGHLAYATPQQADSTNLWAAFVLAVVGLGLIALGGCFLIGIMVFHIPGAVAGGLAPTPWTPGRLLFVLVLYLSAGGCFTGAGYVLVHTCSRLFRMLGG